MYIAFNIGRFHELSDKPREVINHI